MMRIHDRRSTSPSSRRPQRSTLSIRTSLLASCVAGLLCACATAPSQSIPVIASDATLELLAGEWWGDYDSGISGRSGRIRMRMATGERVGDGEVVMFTRASIDLPNPANRGEEGGVAEVLSIRFVQINTDDLTVVGNLEPYRDPECGCILSTAFIGRLDGDQITGTFMSHGGPFHPTTRGSWRVHRVRPKIEGPGG